MPPSARSSYFPSKGALVAEVQREAIDRLAASALLMRTDSDRLAAEDGLTDGDLVAFRLVAFGRWFCASAVTFPEEIRLMQSLMGEWRSHVPMDEIHRVLPTAMALLDQARAWSTRPNTTAPSRPATAWPGWSRWPPPSAACSR